MNWQLKTFNELTPQQIHAIYKARTNVFVVEQHCPYPEVDDWDLTSFHLFLENSGAVIAYCRLIETADEVKLGRVLVVQSYRQNGLGRDLVTKALEVSAQLFPQKNIYAQVQAYLKNFYASFGFEATSAEYTEDGIPHLDMIRG
ncbi:GNAT family N-acetyltransferase [Streptococcus sp. S784/96/1]|uniref:GNAT family N-acetyltransferase n=1 Tax=Streptococcus sp. S784/96/1 TaxID=2653499 RepID=UPI0013898303|nr:GNAT family N-acetyltransferase [Streptococcus sp. S784/96/1]